MAVAAVLAGVTCTSCSSDDDPVVPPVPEVVESEVLESGCSDDVSETSGTEGTSLSYESWIYVRQTTRATSENKISVTLFNRFNNLVQEAEVADFNFGEPKEEISYRVSDSRVEQNYVTVTDSVMVYGLTYANGFKLEYELMFETPEYNDGVTRQMMPYHKVERIIDNGTNVSAMENETQNGKTYYRKLLQNSITVVYNGRNYDVAASVVVRSEIPAEDVLLSSEKVNEGLEFVSSDVENAAGVYRSWIEVEQNWSESGKKTVKKEVLLNHNVKFPNNVSMRDLDYKLSNWDNFSVKQTIVEPEINYGDIFEGVVVNEWKNGISIRVTKSDAADFRVNSYVTCVEERAVYKDDKLSCDFPYPEFSALDVSFVNVHDWQIVTDDEMGEYYKAECKFNFSISCANNINYTSSNGIIFVYHE